MLCSKRGGLTHVILFNLELVAPGAKSLWNTPTIAVLESFHPIRETVFSRRRQWSRVLLQERMTTVLPACLPAFRSKPKPFVLFFVKTKASSTHDLRRPKQTNPSKASTRRCDVKSATDQWIWPCWALFVKPACLRMSARVFPFTLICKKTARSSDSNQAIQLPIRNRRSVECDIVCCCCNNCCCLHASFLRRFRSSTTGQSSRGTRWSPSSTEAR